jgi:hypothetical protein
MRKTPTLRKTALLALALNGERPANEPTPAYFGDLYFIRVLAEESGFSEDEIVVEAVGIEAPSTTDEIAEVAVARARSPEDRARRAKTAGAFLAALAARTDEDLPALAERVRVLSESPETPD